MDLNVFEWKLSQSISHNQGINSDIRNRLIYAIAGGSKQSDVKSRLDDDTTAIQEKPTESMRHIQRKQLLHRAQARFPDPDAVIEGLTAKPTDHHPAYLCNRREDLISLHLV